MPSSLYVMNADGSGQRRIPHTADADGDASWSPDGTRLAFDAGSPSLIYTIAIDGTQRRRVARVPAESSFPAWSPDGTQIAFDATVHISGYDSRYEVIYAIRSDGTGLRRLTSKPSEYASWTRDGHQIVFNRYRTDGRDLGEFIAEASGGRAVRLLAPSSSLANSDPSLLLVSCSPDGEAIVASGFPGSTSAGIYLANADGSGLTFVTHGHDASWRPEP
jgi:Tol biopolymer transport system component